MEDFGFIVELLILSLEMISLSRRLYKIMETCLNLIILLTIIFRSSNHRFHLVILFYLIIHCINYFTEYQVSAPNNHRH